jgi:molybdopterin-guanine dinucleotide biosynthesis protein A
VSNPQNAYGMSKFGEEMVAVNLGRRYGIPTVALRYSIVQGPRQSVYNAYSGACRIFCLSYLLDGAPVLYEDGQNVRDYVNIEDVVDANVLVLEDEAAVGQVFNVGGGKPVTTAEFAEIARRQYSSELPASVTGEYRFGDTRHILSDISKLGHLGWKPQRTPVDSVRAYSAVVGGDAGSRWCARRGQRSYAGAWRCAQGQRQPMKAFLLAAGLGTRLRPLTDTVPKCMLPIGDRPLLGIWLDAFARAGVDEVLVNLHYLPDVVTRYLAERTGPPVVRTTYEPELLGSAGTLLANRALVEDEPLFLACYADNLTDFDLRELVDAHLARGGPATLALFRAENPRAVGIVELDSEARIVAFTEKPEHPTGNLANAGMYAFSPSVLDEIDGAATSRHRLRPAPKAGGQEPRGWSSIAT